MSFFYLLILRVQICIILRCQINIDERVVTTIAGGRQEQLLNSPWDVTLASCLG